MASRTTIEDLREAVRLAALATTGVTGVVEEMHRHIASGPAVLGQPLALPARLVTGVAYGSVRGVTRLVGKSIDRLLLELAPAFGEHAPGPTEEAVRAALNGVLGDWLVETKSPLAIPMTLRQPTTGDRSRIAVFVHGSSMNDRHWRWGGHDHGELLAREHGWAPVYVHYNTGLPIAENGRLLAEALEAVADAERIAIIGHSMGGLVARMACHVADTDGGRAWRPRLVTLVTLGSPHLGSPLERGGHILDRILPLTGYSAPLARLGKLRSAGITDMRWGLDVPLPEGVACWAIAAGEDRLVPRASAHGPFPAARCTVVSGTSHLDLLGSREAYATIVRALEGEATDDALR